MKNYPFFPARRSEILDGAWDFRWLGEDADIETISPSEISYNEIMAVPGVFDTCPDYFGKRGVGIYRKRVFFPLQQDSLLRLKIGGMGLYAKIWWNNREIGEYNLPYSSLDYDFSEERTSPENEIVIAVDNRFNFEKTPLFSPNFDFYGYGGVYRSIELQELPSLYLERVQVKTLDINNGSIELKILLGGNVPSELPFSISFDHADAFSFVRQVQNNCVILEQKVPEFKIWSPEKPQLHTVTVSIAGDKIIERFGIRKVETRGKSIMLNGTPLYLKGVNRHESHPEFGPVQNTHLMLDDLRLLKDIGCNFVRCVHYPQNQEFLDLCDEIGLLVWHESMGWNDEEAHVLDQHFFDLQIKQTHLLVYNSINHPSIILWGFMNECCSNTEGGKKLYEILSRTIKSEDPALLVTYASNRKEKDICYEFADVIAMTMYPGWIEAIDDWSTASSKYIETFINEKAKFAERFDLKEKPFIVAEIGASALYGCHDRALAQWSEEYQADYFAEACRCIMNNPRYCGLALWQFCDTRSFVNAGQVRCKPRGFNCAGLLDEYRRPKIAYDIVKQIYNQQQAKGF